MVALIAALPLAGATLVTSIDVVHAAEDTAPIVSYSFDEISDGVVLDNSGHGNDGIVRGAGVEVVDGELRLPGGKWNNGDGAYVEVPVNDLVGKESLTVSLWLENETGAGNYAAAYIGNSKVDNGYWLLNPSNLDGIVKSVVTNASVSAPNSEPYFTEIGTGATGNPKDGTKSVASMAMYTSVIDKEAGQTSFYLNGEKVSEVATTVGISDYADSEADLKAYIGRSSYPDIFFKGAVGKYEVFTEGLNESQVTDLYAAEAPTFAFKQLEVPEEAESSFSLPTRAAGLDVSWSVVEGSEFADVDESGQVTIGRPLFGEGDGTVVLRATILTQTRDFTVLVPAEATSWEEQVEAAATQLSIHNSQSMKENFSVPLSGAYGTSIQWQIVSDLPGFEIVDGQTDDTQTVMISRPSTGMPAAQLHLQAIVSKGQASEQKDFEVTIPALPEGSDEFEAYVWAYFTGEGQGGEKISLAASKGNDALSWNTLNDKSPLIASTEGTKGLRDPFIMRSKDGDRYYLIATDLKIDGLQGGFMTAQFAGSKYIEIWESDDLVNWSNQRHVKVSSDYAGNTWAPEAYYDADEDQYIVYWASNLYDTPNASDRTTPTYNRMVYVTTSDFVTFSEPQVWVDVDRRGQAGAGTIDVTMQRTNDGTWHRFIKDEKTMMIRHEKSSDPYAKVEGTLPTAGESEGWSLVQENVGKGIPNGLGGQGQGEGPSIFPANKADVNGYGWYLFIDQPNYHGGPNHYVPFGTADLTSPSWVGELSKLQSSIPTLSDGGHPRHGTVMPISRSEYQELLAGLQPNLAVSSYDPINVSTTIGNQPVLPKVTLHKVNGADETVNVDWETIDNEMLAEAGSFDVAGIAQDDSRMPIEATITVVDSIESSAELVDLTVAGKAVDLNADPLVAVVDSVLAISEGDVEATPLDRNAQATVTINRDESTVEVAVTSKDGTTSKTYLVTLVAPRAHYDMTMSGETLTDISDQGSDGTIVDLGEGAFASYEAGKVMTLAQDGYVKLPQGPLTAESNDFTIEMTVNAYAKADHFAWVVGDGVGPWNTTALGNHVFMNPNSAQGGYQGEVMGAIRVKDSGNGESRMPSAGKTNAGFSTVTMVSQGDTLRLYIDGTQRSELKHSKNLRDIIKGDTLGYIGRSLYQGDPLFSGKISDFKIYDVALSSYDVAVSMPSMASKSDLSWQTIEEDLETILLGDNDSKDDITGPLNFASEVDGWPLTWVSSNENVISADGSLGSVSRDESVTITVSDSVGHSKTVKVKVRFISDEAKAEADLDAIMLQERATENLPLVAVGSKNASQISWTSSDDSLVSSTDLEYSAPNVGAADPYQGAGVISRPSYGNGDSESVTLTAVAEHGDASVTRTWEVTVAEMPRWAPDQGYASAYFKSDNDEKIYEAATTKNDFFTFQEVNQGKAVIDNTATGTDTGGLRDPYILRSHDGDKYYMIATDLKIGGNGGNWGPAQSEGSLKVEVWESTDMVTWTPTNGEAPGITVNQPSAGMTWAPEAYWDDDLQAYVLFFASRIYKDDAHTDTDWYAQMFYVITRDFVTYTYPPATWQNTGHARIDSTVMKIDDYYYRFTKNEENNGADGLERGKDIFVEKSKVLTASTTKSDWDADPNETWQLVDTAMTTPKTGNAGEGPEIVKLNEGDPNNTPDDDGYVFLVDNYSAGGYVPFVTTGAEISTSGKADRISKRESWVAGAQTGLPKSPRHGAFVNVPKTVLDAMHDWSAVSAVPSQIQAEVDGRHVAVSVAAEDGGDVAGWVVIKVGDWSKTVRVTPTSLRLDTEVTVPWNVEGPLEVEYIPHDNLVEPATFTGANFELGTAVLPESPVFDDSECGVAPTVTLPDVDGVEYALVKEGTLWSVTATPTEGFYFENESQTVTWNYDGSIPVCPGTVDKTELLELIEKARGLDSEVYSASSWANLTAALEAAIEVADNPDATESEIAQAGADLRAALEALETIGGEGSAVEVEAAPPILVPASSCGEVATVRIPEVEGVSYVSRNADGIVTVTATADDGYFLTGDVDSVEWTFDTSATTCPPASGGGSSDLASTGASVGAVLTLSLLALGVGLVLRRKSNR